MFFAGCNGGAPNAVPNANQFSMQHPAASITYDGPTSCQFGKIHVYNGPIASGGNGGELQIVSDRKGNLWYGDIKANAIVEFVRRNHAHSHLFSIPSTNAKPEGITIDSHGHFWFTEFNLPQLGRVSPTGGMTQYTIPGLTSASESIDDIIGPDKRVWFTTDFNGIGARDASGNTVLYNIANNSEQPTKLANGPDGNLWFTEYAGANIGKITPSGMVKEYNVGGGANNFGIVGGPHNTIWWTDSANRRVGMMKTNGTNIKYFSVGTGSPAEIAYRPQDGKFYFTMWEGMIGQVTPTGKVHVCTIPATPTFVAFGIVENPVDKSMWFVDNSGSVDRIGELSFNK
jgi:streptogramin lyase